DSSSCVLVRGCPLRLRRISGPLKKPQSLPWSSAGTLGYRLGGFESDIHPRARPTSQDNLRKVLFPVELKTFFKLEAGPERFGERSQPRRRPHEGEGLQEDPDRTKSCSLGKDEIQRPILHRRIKAFFANRGEPVDLVNKENISPLEARKKAHH